MARKKIGIEEQILEYVESGPVGTVELLLRLANARFKKRIGPFNSAAQRVRGRKKKTAPPTEMPSA